MGLEQDALIVLQFAWDVCGVFHNKVFVIPIGFYPSGGFLFFFCTSKSQSGLMLESPSPPIQSPSWIEFNNYALKGVMLVYIK